MKIRGDLNNKIPYYDWYNPQKKGQQKSIIIVFLCYRNQTFNNPRN